MKEKEYNDQMLTAYLLGTLPEADAERFDELSFIDDDFAVALQAAENDLADRYTHGELSGATLDRFESHYLASPLRRRKVEFAEALKVQTNKKFVPAKEIAALDEIEPKRTFGEIVAGIFTIPRPFLQWTFALAALALIFFGGWVWNENSRLRTEISRTNQNREEILKRESELAEREKQLQEEIANQRAAGSDTEKELAQIREERARLEQELKRQTQEKQRLAEQRKIDEQQQQQRAARNTPPTSAPRGGIAAFVLAPSLRGGSGNRVQTVSIPSDTVGAAVALEVESDEYAIYRAVLRSAASEKILWRSGNLKSKSVGGGSTRLNVGFPAKLLKNGFYTIELTGIAADGAEEIISDYSFRVMR